MTLSEARTIAAGPVTFGDARAIEARRLLALYEEVSAVTGPVHCWEPGCRDGDGTVECSECAAEEPEGCETCSETGFIDCPMCGGEQTVKLATMKAAAIEEMWKYGDRFATVTSRAKPTPRRKIA